MYLWLTLESYWSRWTVVRLQSLDVFNLIVQPPHQAGSDWIRSIWDFLSHRPVNHPGCGQWIQRRGEMFWWTCRPSRYLTYRIFIGSVNVHPFSLFFLYTFSLDLLHLLFIWFSAPVFYIRGNNRILVWVTFPFCLRLKLWCRFKCSSNTR